MTICIAAACENKYVVVATDRMLTVYPLNIEFEADYAKTIEITKNCVAMTSGSAIAFTPLFREVSAEILREGTKDVDRIVELIRMSYLKIRNKRAEEEVLFPIGLTLEKFYENQQTLNQQVIATGLQNLARYDYRLWLLVGGVDDKGAHITRIENPGKILPYDSIGYHAIGSGESHALSTFIVSGYGPKATLQRGLAVAFEAKKRSEKAPGVGAQTDMYVVTEGNTTHLPQEAIKELNEIYEKRLEKEEKVFLEVEDMISRMNIQKRFGQPSGGQQSN